jgi:hypothetical protein
MLRDLLIAVLALATIIFSLGMLRAKKAGATQTSLNKFAIVIQLLILAGIITVHPPTDFMTWVQLAMAFSVGMIIAGAYLKPRKDDLS